MAVAEAARHGRRPQVEARDEQSGTALEAGVVLNDRFILDHRVGEGGVGVVWAARDIRTREPVALKLLRIGAPNLAERLRREGRLASTICHPNLLNIREIIELASGPALVMDLLEGMPLSARLACGGPVPAEECARLLLPIVDVVAKLHERKIVHRDLKPANIFLCVNEDGSVRPIVLDLGIARSLSEEATTRRGLALGTPRYMAPEQLIAAPDVDERADVWALGVIFYEALTGAWPITSTRPLTVLRALTSAPIEPLRTKVPNIDADTAAIVASMLALDRASRPSAREVHRSLSQRFAEVRL